MSAPRVTTEDAMPSEDVVRGSHKHSALEFLRLSAAGQAREAFDAYVGPGFRHHNPYFRSDAESLIAGMEKNATENPGKVLEVLRAIEEGAFVAVHTRIQHRPDDAGWSVIHVFRFEEDQIVEMWDVGQEAIKDSPNEAGLF